MLELKQSIIRSRYQAARLANREQLLLYIYIGSRLSEKIKAEKWGAGVLESISNDLQKELPGLRGFSVTNLKKMRQFADEYLDLLIGPSVTVQLKKILNTSSKNTIGPSATVQFAELINTTTKKPQNPLRISKAHTNALFSISFTHHITILNKCNDHKERFFYINSASEEMWSVSTLEHHIRAKLYKKQGKLPNNFKATLPAHITSAALNAFKDEYLFDFMTLEDTEDERVLEEAVVANIRKFILSIGKGFSFIGNQYKLDIDGQEFFIDLLFYNRLLQCLVVFELKRGKFKPEYAGQINFYLNVLDDKVKLPNENPSIGIILCKEKNNAVVEYAFKNTNKAVGVATYKLSTEVPKAMKGILPNAAELKKLL